MLNFVRLVGLISCLSRPLLGSGMCCCLLLVLLLWLLLLLAFAPSALLFQPAPALPCILLLSLACKSFHSSNTFSRFPFLAKTGLSWDFFSIFFRFFLNIVFSSVFLRFFFDFGGFLEAFERFVNTVLEFFFEAF